MKRSIQLTTVRGGKVLHTNPEGNRHSVCGIVSEYKVYGPDAAKAIMAGTHRFCKNCARVKPVRDLNPVVRDEPTDVWTVTDKAGEQLGRVTARDIQCAGRIARQDPTMSRVSKREGGLSFQRLRESQL